MKVLIAEDDANIRAGLETLLASEGYEPRGCADGDSALSLFHEWQPDLVLLDIMMPGMDGYSVCRSIRKTDEQVPVIFISAKSEEIDRVLGLELGADDFIMKPFGLREVIARIRAVTRRTLQARPAATATDNSFSMRDLSISPNELRARRGDSTIELSLRDIKILQTLQARAGEVVSRDELFNTAWGRDYLPSSRTLDQHISKLRKLIERDAGNPEIIQTVHGAGYRFDP